MLLDFGKVVICYKTKEWIIRCTFYQLFPIQSLFDTISEEIVNTNSSKSMLPVQTRLLQATMVYESV